MRLDTFLSKKYHFSRNKAKQLIQAGLVKVNTYLITKPSQQIHENDIIEITEDKRLHWVSRSAKKLFDFIENNPYFFLHISNAICLDIGSSTGGFTQVLIEKGAKHIDAVDVGTGQLHESLKKYPHVFSFENTDIRHFKTEKKYDFIVCDASFISLEKIIPSIKHLSHGRTIFILLFKPQFEVGKDFLTKNGIPKNEKIIHERMLGFEIFFQNEGFLLLTKTKSTLLGEAGNQEWIYCLKKVITKDFENNKNQL